MSDQSYLDQYEGQGREDIGANDVTIPFLKILQKLSPECDEAAQSYVKGSKAGMFMNSLTKELYGNSVEFIPVRYEPVWLEWAPNRGGFKGRHAIGSVEVYGDQFSKEGLQTEKGNQIQETLIFYGYIANHLEDGPIILSLSSSQLKHAKNWNARNINTRLHSGKRAPFFASVWKLELVLNTNTSGTWYMLGTKTTTAIEHIRFITQKELEEYILPARKMLMAAKIDYAQIEDKTGESSDKEAVPF
jgi:hypothetical protein